MRCCRRGLRNYRKCRSCSSKECPQVGELQGRVAQVRGGAIVRGWGGERDWWWWAGLPTEPAAGNESFAGGGMGAETVVC